MKTQRELNLHYWGEIHEIVEDYNKVHGCDVKPNECVKNVNSGLPYRFSPAFDSDPGSYQFAVAILYDEQEKQHRAIFPGDELFYLGEKVKAKDFCNGVLTFEDGGAVSLSISGRVSWNLPQPKRTFEVSGVELPCPFDPGRDEEYEEMNICFKGVTYSYCFRDENDGYEVFSALVNKLDEARDK